MANPYMSGPLSDVGLQPSNTPTDFSFLQQGLARKQGQFEQGLEQVANGYSSILNAPLTTAENIDQRNQYISQVQEGLKKVATTDLSLPQNTAQAEKLYEPFWKDQDILYDQAATKSLQSEYQKAESARTATKEDARSTFDPASLGPLDNARQKLATAKRGDGSISKIYQNLPKWTPFIDLDKDISDWKEKDKPDISWTDNYHTDASGKQVFDPANLYIHHNGPKTINAWTTMVARHMGDRTNPQFDVLGSNLYNNEVKNFMHQNPDADPDAAKQAVLSKYFQPILDKKTQLLDGYQSEITDRQTRLDNLNKTESTSPNGLTKAQIAQRNGLTSEINQLQSEMLPIKTSYNNFSRILKQGSPSEGYVTEQLAGLLKDRAIQTYAEGFAVETKDDVKENAGYFQQQNINARLAELKETHQYHEREFQNENLDRSLEYMKLYADHPELANQGVPAVPGQRKSGLAANDVQHLTVAEQYLRDMDTKKRSIASNLVGTPNVVGSDKYGAFSQLLQNPDVGVTPQELNVFNKIQLANQEGNLRYNPDGSFILDDPQETKLYNSAVSKLAKNMGVKVESIQTADAAMKLLVDYGKKWVQNSTSDGTDIERANYYTSLYNNTSDLYTKVQQDLDTHEKMMTAEVNRYPDAYKHSAVQNPNGTYHLIGQRDLIPGSFDLSVRGENDSKEYNYSAAEIADMYRKGRIDVHYPSNSAAPYLVIDGQEVHPLAVGGKNYQHDFDMKHTTGIGKWWAGEGSSRTDPHALGDVMRRIQGWREKFGSSADIANDVKNVSESVIPHAEYYKQGTGRVPLMISFPITGKMADNANYLSDALKPGNRLTIQDANGEPVGSSETIDKLSSLSDDVNVSKYIGRNQDVILSPYGTPQMVVHVKGGLDKDDPYYNLSGKTFWVGIKPDAQSELLKKFPMAQDREMYDPLYSSKSSENTVQSDQIAKSLGINVVLTKSPQGKGFTINGTYFDIDPETGNKIPRTVYIPLTASTASEARGYMNAAVQKLTNSYYKGLSTYTTRNGTKLQQ